jgi:hypothetical protein
LFSTVSDATFALTIKVAINARAAAAIIEAQRNFAFNLPNKNAPAMLNKKMDKIAIERIEPILAVPIIDLLLTIIDD